MKRKTKLGRPMPKSDKEEGESETREAHEGRMRIRRCVVCGSYTMEERHCGRQTEVAHPPIFKRSLRLAVYRVISKGETDCEDVEEVETWLHS